VRTGVANLLLPISSFIVIWFYLVLFYFYLNFLPIIFIEYIYFFKDKFNKKKMLSQFGKYKPDHPGHLRLQTTI
jgi:hypothetical protein